MLSYVFANINACKITPELLPLAARPHGMPVIVGTVAFITVMLMEKIVMKL